MTSIYKSEEGGRAVSAGCQDKRPGRLPGPLVFASSRRRTAEPECPYGQMMTPSTAEVAPAPTCTVHSVLPVLMVGLLKVMV